jgi:hypothetical protein
LKRAIDRELVHSLSNLIATQQVRAGDLIRVDYDAALGRMCFFKEAEDMPAYAMVQMVETSTAAPQVLSTGATIDVPRAANARSSRR